jgi:calcium-dependent protein kinase
MLVGLPPWEFARPEDPRYKMVVKGKLARMLESWKRPVSPAAADLLQKMLMEDPRQRLSLTEVKDHPWVVDDDSTSDSAPYHQGNGGDEGWRR